MKARKRNRLMTHLIDKDAVVAGIDDWRSKIKKGIFSIPLSGKEKAYATFEYEVLGKVISFLDSLEVKEVNLNEEIERFVKSEEFQKASGTIRVTDLLVKHFFELGLKAQKGE